MDFHSCCEECSLLFLWLGASGVMSVWDAPGILTLDIPVSVGAERAEESVLILEFNLS